MKLLLRLVFLACCAATASASPVPMPVSTPAGFKLHRGVNLSHWLSQCPDDLDRDRYITERDFAYLHEIGYDHVRLPVDEIELWAADGTRNRGAFDRLAAAVAWARAHDLRLIVDLHTVRTHHFNSEFGANTLWTDPAAQEKFLALWRDLSEVLKSTPVDSLAYEIMNEPVADRAGDWNALLAKAHAEIRRLEPQRVIVIGSNRWQGAATFPQLEVPAGDKNLILSVHDYEPFVFTHHEAKWTNLRDYHGPVHYPGFTIAADDFERISDPELRRAVQRGKDRWDRARLAAHLAPAIARAKELGLPLYCGEFGCLPSVPRRDRLAWYADLVSVFEANGLAYANWEYKAEFGIVSYQFKTHTAGKPDGELIRILLPRP